jgi:hypothetical protein
MSGVGYIGKTINASREVIAQQAISERESMWGPIDGEIVDYDASTQTATVQPLYKPRHNGKPIDMPELVKVPVNFPRTGSGAITSPLPAGTRVRLTPQMRNSELYHTEDNGEAFDQRSFALSDMEASIAGGDPLTQPLENVDPDVWHMRFNADGTHGIKGHPDGRFKIEGNQGNVYELIGDAVEQAQIGFDALSTEPTLIHTATYAGVAAALDSILGKLRAMQL